MAVWDLYFIPEHLNDRLFNLWDHVKCWQEDGSCGNLWFPACSCSTQWSWQIPGAGNLEYTAQSAASSTGCRVFLLSASAGLHLFNEAWLVGVSRKQLGWSLLLPCCLMWASSEKLSLSETSAQQPVFKKEGPSEPGQFRGFLKAILSCSIPVLMGVPVGWSVPRSLRTPYYFTAFFTFYFLRSFNLNWKVLM